MQKKETLNSRKLSYFLGANSPEGFFSYFNELYSPSTAQRVYILKGGPGTGKSTLMNAVVSAAEQIGLTVETIPCCSDPASLDGVRIPELETALVDGTWPHVVEPIYPGAVEVFVDLGQFWDRGTLTRHKKEIISLHNKIKECYRSAYRSIRAAKTLLDDRRAVAASAANTENLRRRGCSLALKCFGNKNREGGGQRKCFFTAIGPGGYFDTYSSIHALCDKVYLIEDDFGLSHCMLEPLLRRAADSGYEAYAGYCPLEPKTKLEHVVVPDMGLAFVSAGRACPYPYAPLRKLHTASAIDKDILYENKGKLKLLWNTAAALLDDAMGHIARVKTLHDKLESIYMGSMDYDRAAAYREKICGEIMGGD